MAKRSHRVFALFGATLFLVSSLGLSVFVIWQMYSQSHSNNSSTASQQQTQPQPTNSSTGKPLPNFQPVAGVPDLQKIDLVTGNGKEVQPTDTVTVNYTGAIASTGKIFQSSKDSGQPVTFALNQVIPGWTIGMPGMKVGGTRRLLIPAKLAYGAQGDPQGGIPPNADLVFDIDLIDIPAKKQ